MPQCRCESLLDFSRGAREPRQRRVAIDANGTFIRHLVLVIDGWKKLFADRGTWQAGRHFDRDRSVRDRDFESLPAAGVGIVRRCLRYNGRASRSANVFVAGNEPARLSA